MQLRILHNAWSVMAAIEEAVEMINVASCPEDLTHWESSSKHPFYFEVFGEAEPKIDVNYAIVQPAGPVGKGTETLNAAPIYEYWWTIGRAGKGDKDADEFWHDLEDPAARVYFFFPTFRGWRIKEFDANVKYLSPVKDHPSLKSAVSKKWSEIGPIVGLGGQVAGFLGGLPGAAAGSMFNQISTNLASLAKLQINSVPPEGDFKWSVRKVTFAKDGIFQGVEWDLPRKVLTDLGGRITGSLALSFIPSQPQAGKSLVSEESWKPQAGKLLTHMVFRKKSGNHWAPGPGPQGFVSLRINPTAP